MENNDIVITSDTLFDLERRERFRAELQQLDKNFFKDVEKYLKEKGSILESQKEKQSIFSDTEAEKTRLQIVNAKKTLKALYDRREQKVVQAALFSARNPKKQFNTSLMLPEEVRMFDSISKTLSQFRDNLLLGMLSEDKPKTLKAEEIKKQQGNAIRLKCDVPEFVGPDMEKYGPFSKGQETELPDKISGMLIDGGNAEKV